jgi:hypothetical protein
MPMRSTKSRADAGISGDTASSLRCSGKFLDLLI